MAKLLSREDLIRGLSELVQELKAREIQAEIFILGGAALALKHFDRRLTIDVDVRMTNYSDVRAAVSEVAKRHGWDDDWINTAASHSYHPTDS